MEAVNEFISKVITRFPLVLSYGILDLIYNKYTRTDSKFQNSKLLSNFSSLNPQESKRVIYEEIQKMLFFEKFDTRILGKLNQNNINDVVSIKGLEILEKLQFEKQPVILYTGHFGRLVLPLISIGLSGIELACLSANPKDFSATEEKFLSKKLFHMQKNMKGPFFHLGKLNKTFFEYLMRKEGSFLVMLIDLPSSKNTASVEVPFIDSKILVPSGIARIARKCGAKVVPYFTWQIGYKVEAQIFTPIDISGLSDQQAMVKLMEPLDAQVRKHPGLWWQWDKF